MGRIVLVIMAVTVIFGAVDFGRPAETQTVSVPEPADGNNYNKLMLQLGDNDWDVREAAHIALQSGAEKLFQEYRRAKKTLRKEKNPSVERKLTELKEEIQKLIEVIWEGRRDSDPEVVLRTKMICRYLYSLTCPKILFIDINKGTQIYLMDADGQNRQEITKDNTQKDCPASNHDGSKIAFSGGVEEKMDIYVADLVESVNGCEVKNQLKLTNKGHNIKPAWSPDGTKIAFVSDRDGEFEIYVMDADGKNQTRLTNDMGYNNSPSWSPDGSKISFASMGGDNPGIYTMDADGRNQNRLFDGLKETSNIAWSPDGSKLAVVSNIELHVLDADGKNQKRLTDEQVMDMRPSWSPDGAVITFAILTNQHIGVAVVDAEGKKVTLLTPVDEDNFNTAPSWKPTELEEFIAPLSEKK
ncbi:MAG: PD40 domain-containing protein [Planctomycetes bacterium]|nr:PD40 domain-containing protein [Planctomycetota bacterium]